MRQQSNHISEMIREVQPDSPTAAGQTIVVLDPENQIVKNPPSTFGRMFRGGHLRHFLVTRERLCQRTGWVLSIIHEGPRELRLAYAVSCPAGNEGQVAKILGHPNPQAALERKIEQWIHSALRSSSNDTIEKIISALPGKVANQAKDHGIRLELDASAPEPSWALNTELPPTHAPFRAKDSGQSFDLSIEIETRVIDPEKAAKNTSRPEDFNSGLIQALQKYSRNQLQLHEFYVGLETTVTEQLKKVLAGALVPLGRKLVRLRLTGGPQIDAEKIASLTSKQSFNLLDQSTSTVILESVLELVNVGQWVEKGKPALDPWFAQATSRLVTKFLSGKSYRQLEFDQEKILDELNKGIQDAALSIGYSATPSIRFTDIDSRQPDEALYSAMVERPIRGLQNEDLVIEIEALLSVQDSDTFAQKGHLDFHPWMLRSLKSAVDPSLHRFEGYWELCADIDSVKEQLVAALTEDGKKVGIGVSEPKVRISPLPVVESTISIRHQVALPLEGLNRAAWVEFDGRLEKEDEVHYLRSGAPELSAWSAEAIEDIVEAARQGKTLESAYGKEKELQEELKKEFLSEAKTIGYRVRPLKVKVVGIETDAVKSLPFNEELPLPRFAPAILVAEGLLTFDNIGSFLRRPEYDLQAWLRNQIREIADQSLVAVSQIQLQFEREAILEGMSDRLKELATGIGYTAPRLQLGLKLLPPPQSGPAALTAQARRPFPEAPEGEVVIEVEALFDLKNKQNYSDTGYPELEPWLRKNFSEIIGAEFHHLETYWDLCAEIDSVNQKLTTSLTEEGKKIGIEVSEPKIRISPLPVAEPAVSIRHRVPLPLEGLTTTAWVEFDGRLEKEQENKYIRSGAPKLNAWSAEAIEDIVEAARQGKTLESTYGKEEELQQELKAEFSKRVKVIGYTVPLLKVKVLGIETDAVKSLPFNVELPLPRFTPASLVAEGLLRFNSIGDFLRRPQYDLQAWLQNQIQAVAGQSLVTISPIQLQFEREAILEEMSNRLKSLAEDIGYIAPRLQLGFRHLSPPQKGPVPLTAQVKHPFSDAPEAEVTVGLAALLNLEDEQKYSESGYPELEPWLQEYFREVLADEFHHLSTYWDLCVEADVLASEAGPIVRKLEEGAASIGFTLSPNLNISPLPTRHSSFQTRERAQLPLDGLQALAWAHFNVEMELSDSETYLRELAPDLREWCAQTATEAVSKSLLKKSLEQVYTHQERFSAELKELFEQAAGRIGYSASVQVLLEGIEIETPDNLTFREQTSLSISPNNHFLGVSAEGNLSLDRASIHLFVRNPVQDLASWWREELQQVLETQLAGVTWLEICLDPDRFQADIEEELSSRAEKISYRSETMVRFQELDRLDQLRFEELTSISISDTEGSSISVQWDALLSLESPQQLLEKAPESIEATTHRAVFEIIREALAGQSLREISLSRSDLEKQIIDNVTAWAGSLGFHCEPQAHILGLIDGLHEPVKIDELRFDCRAKGRGPTIQVEIDGILQVDDLDTYKKNGCPDLEQWASQKIPQIFQGFIIKTDYADLCVNLETRKNEIEALVRHQGRALGIDLSQLISIFNVLERFREGIQIRFSQPFATEMSGFYVDLDITADFRIQDMKEIEDTLINFPYLEQHIEKVVLRRIEQEVRSLDPAEIYTEFQTELAESSVGVSSDFQETQHQIRAYLISPGSHPQGPQTEEISYDDSESKDLVAQGARGRIIKAIQDTLTSEFHADVLDIRCEQNENELTRAWKGLTRGFHDLNITRRSLNGDPPLEIRCSLNVDSISGADGWRLFEQKRVRPRPAAS